MKINVTKNIDVSQIAVKMEHNIQSFNDDFPLGFMSPCGFIRFQVQEESVDGTPRYSYPGEKGSYGLSLFGEEYNGGESWGVSHGDWIPLNTPKEVLMALEIQKYNEERLDNLSTKRPNTREILSQFMSPDKLSVLSSDVINSIVDALDKSVDEAIKLNK